MNETPVRKLTVDEAIALAKKEAKKGNLLKAQQLYAAVLQQEPRHPLAKKGLRNVQKQMPLSNLADSPTDNPSPGQMNALRHLFESGQMNKAERVCKELLQSHPNSMVVINLLSAALGAQGKLQEAVQTCDKAIQLKPDNAEAHGNRGAALQQLGHLEEAVKSYDVALQFKPEYPEALYNRGIALNNLGQPGRAVKSYDTLIRVKPDYAAAYYNRGNALQLMGQHASAVESYKKATQLHPDYSESYCNSGVSLQSLGEMKRAARSYEKAIDLKPDYAEAHLNLCMLKKFKPDDVQIKAMEKLYTDPKTSENDRVRFCFALGKVFEDLGEHDKAFHYLHEGNKSRKLALRYNIDTDKDLIRKIRHLFTLKNSPLKVSSGRTASPQPVFVIGMPRSGTSLVEQILASHSKVYGGGELPFLNNLLNPLISNLSEEDATLGQGQLSEVNLEKLRQGYLNALTTLKVSEKIVTDKMPLNFRWVGFIRLALPEAKIIHLNRDPMATCWSIYKRDFSMKGNEYANDMEDLAEYYKLYCDLMSFWHEQFPTIVYELCYEDLTENQEQETRNLLNFCELEWEAQCMDFHETKRVVHTASAAQVRTPMYQGSSDAWQKFETHLKPLIRGLSTRNK